MEMHTQNTQKDTSSWGGIQYVGSFVIYQPCNADSSAKWWERGGQLEGEHTLYTMLSLM